MKTATLPISHGTRSAPLHRGFEVEGAPQLLWQGRRTSYHSSTPVNDLESSSSCNLERLLQCRHSHNIIPIRMIHIDYVSQQPWSR